MGFARLQHVVDASLLALVLAGGVALALVVAHVDVPAAVLPAAVAVAALRQAWRAQRRPAADAVSAPPVPPALAVGTLAVLALAAGVLAWGALATSSRFWDGAAMWDWKARWLAERLTLEQPAFRDADVYCHSRDYPLLQPLLMAMLERTVGAARLLFPLLHALQCALLACAVRRGTGAGGFACAAALAFGLTPVVMSPASGSFDSGYADAFAGVAVTAIVAGFAVGERLWLCAGIALVVWVKPEGLLYGGLATMLAWLGSDRARLAVAVASFVGAAALALVVQRDLQTLGHGGPPWPLLAALAVGGGLALGSQRLLPRRPQRLAWLALAIPTALVAAPFVARHLGLGSGTFAAYLDDPARLWQRLGSLPAILGGLLTNAVLRGSFGLAFVLPVLVALSRPLRTRAVVPLAWLLGAVLLTTVPFLLSPLDDLAHHLRSTMPRLLFHQLGAAVLAAGLALAPPLRADLTPCSAGAA